MIILSARTMSPRNVVNRVISASSEELVLLKEAAAFFKSACRSVVGYKQLIARTGLDIIVDSKAKIDLPEIALQFETVSIEPVVIRPAVLDKFKVKRRKTYDIVNPNMVVPKVEPLPIPKWVAPAFEGDLWVPEDMVNEIANVIIPPMPEDIYVAEHTMDDYVVPSTVQLYREEVLSVDFTLFVQEIQKGLLLKATRGREDVAGVVKAIWNKYKGMFISDTDKVASKQFCIEVHNSFNQLMDEQPRHWFFISVSTYVRGYFQEAIARCTP